MEKPKVSKKLLNDLDSELSGEIGHPGILAGIDKDSDPTYLPEDKVRFLPNGSFRPSDRFYRQTDEEFFRVDKIEQRENGPTTLTMQPDPVITEEACGEDQVNNLKDYVNGPPNREVFFAEVKALPTILNIHLNPNNPVDLFGEPLPVSKQSLPPETFPDNIIGEDIIKIRALTGKAQDRAKDALKAAAVEFLAAASPDCFWVPGNVASSKNNKDIGFYLKKSDKTGKMERIHVLVDSARTKKYKRDTKGYWLQNKIEFLNQTRHLPLPLHIEFTFIRDSLRAFDFINACQVLADLMGPKENGYFVDDDSCHFLPIFNPVVYYHPETPGVLFRVIKEDGRNA